MIYMEQSNRISIKELKALTQQTAPNPSKETSVGKFTRLFSAYTTWFFIKTPITPNQISLLSALVYLAGLAVLFSPSYYITLLAPALYFLSIVLDGSDGEVARYKKMGSKFGGSYVEPVSHDNLYAVTFIGIALMLYLETGDGNMLIFGALASISKSLYRLIQIRFWNAAYAGTEFAKKEEQNKKAAERGLLHRIFDKINSGLFSYTGIFLPFTIAVIAERLDVFLYFYGIGMFLLYILLLTKHMRIVIKDGGRERFASRNE